MIGVRLRRLILAAILCCAAVLAGPASAHPHVWIMARAELVYAANGRVEGVRHRWTFDPSYSTYVTQGLDKNGDGKLTPDELQELARTNVENLSEYDYFTVLKAGGAKQVMEAPREPSMSFEDGALTLTFLLPLKTPSPNRLVTLEVYDPTYFVAFSIAEGDDAVRLMMAPKGCATTVTRPKSTVATQQPNMSEAFFEALTAASNFGSSYANRILVACP